jgi:hypothetical protein
MKPNLSFPVLESNCRDLAELRGKLRAKLEAKMKAIHAIEAEHNPGLRELKMQCQAARAAIELNLIGTREHFIKPKTREYFGITVGFEKNRDGVIYPEESVLIPRAEAMLTPKQKESVLDRSVRVVKSAFKKLPREVLQKLGCTFTLGADQPIIRASDDDVEKLVGESLGNVENTEAA